MTLIEKLKLVHALCMNLVDGTSIHDPRMSELIGIRNGIEEVVTELESVNEQKIYE